jgi:integrase
MNCVAEFSLGNYILEKYVPYHASKRLKNTYCDLKMIGVIMGYDIVHKPLAEITKNDLSSFFAELQQTRNICKATVNRYRARLSTVFNYALEEDDIARSPLKAIKRHKEKCRSRCLSVDEINALLKECRASRNKELYHITVIALNTGMRAMEILTLIPSDINLRQKKIVLRRALTKSGESREIPLNKEACHILNECLAACCNNSDGRLFRSRDFSCAFEHAMERAKVELARFHDLRRTFATHLMDKGVAISIISRILGHSSILTTQRYLSYGEAVLLDSVSKIGFK